MDMDGRKDRPSHVSKHGSMHERAGDCGDGDGDNPRPAQKSLLSKFEPHDVFAVIWIVCVTVLALRHGMTDDITAMTWALIGLLVGRRTRRKSEDD